MERAFVLLVLVVMAVGLLFLAPMIAQDKEYVANKNVSVIQDSLVMIARLLLNVKTTVLIEVFADMDNVTVILLLVAQVVIHQLFVQINVPKEVFVFMIVVSVNLDFLELTVPKSCSVAKIIAVEMVFVDLVNVIVNLDLKAKFVILLWCVQTTAVTTGFVWEESVCVLMVLVALIVLTVLPVQTRSTTKNSVSIL